MQILTEEFNNHGSANIRYYEAVLSIANSVVCLDSAGPKILHHQLFLIKGLESLLSSLMSGTTIPL
jgi:hypothetical protein